MARYILLSLFIALGSVPCIPGAYAGETSPRAYTVREVWEAFEKSPQDAQAAFVGKRILVEGVVTQSGPSVYATPKVELSDVEGGKSYAACILPRSDFFKLAEYKKGMKVRFSGSCRGLTTNGNMVLLKESNEVK